MGHSAPLRPTVFHPRSFIVAVLAVALSLSLSNSANAQTPEFDFGDGRHGSFTVPAGETTIQDLWSQLRLGTDATAYDPNNSDQVPALENLTISGGGMLSASSFAGSAIGVVDPTEGGVLRIKVRGTLTIEAGAAIQVSGRGYRGGTLEGDAPGRIGQQGDSWGNGGGISGEANRGGGGGGFGELSGGNNPGAGGGGGHREAGERGTTGTGADTSGFGGAAFDTVATSLGQTFRDMYPYPRFGSGGGRGGQVATFANINAQGGHGGGVIVIEAARIVNNGSILAEGSDGGSDLSAGGGGGGGSVWVQSLSAENGTVSVAGGAGGVGTVLGNDGGDGGPGISLWDARFELMAAFDGMGSISLSPEGGLYDPDTEVTVTATPDAGWAFDRWEGDLAGAGSTDMLTMDSDKTVTAFFVELPSLAVTPTSQDVGPDGSTVSFDVAVTNNTGDVNWTAVVASGGDFATISAGASGTNDGTVTVAVAESTSPAARTATVTVSSSDVGTDPVTLTINQSAAVPSLEVTPASSTVSAAGEELVVQVRNAGTGSFDWTASVLTGTTFASITSGGTGTDDGTFVVTFTENLSALQRTATVSVAAPGASNTPVEIDVVQQAGAPLLQVSPSSQLLGSAAGTASVSISNGGNGSMNWTAAIVDGGSFAAISEGSSGTNAGLVTVSLIENTGSENRTVTIRVESPDAANAPVEVTLTQTAQEAVLQVSPDSQRVGSRASTVSFQVQNTGTGSMGWTASVVDGANFVSITDGSAGTNAGIITVSVGENSSTAERTATIQIQAPGAANNPQSVTIVQTPRTPVLRVVPAEQSVGSTGGPVSITIENGGAGALNWTASLVTGAEFITFSTAANGSGDSALLVTLSQNTTEETREGTIRIEAPGADGSPQIATITQLGCVLLGQPQNVVASDGTFPDSVELIWSALPNAAEYEVFRSPLGATDQVELLGTTPEPRFSDLLAEAPSYERINQGCLNPGEFLITNVFYSYYIKAVNACGAGELSEGSTGHRGLPLAESAKLRHDHFVETALPNRKTADGAHLLAGENEIAIRLADERGIDPDSIWIEAGGIVAAARDTLWIPASGDNTDGWAVLMAPDTLPVDTLTSASAGGLTADGQPFAAATVDFYRSNGADESVTSEVEALPYLLAEETDGLFLEGVGPVHQIAPLSAFDDPALVWIPVPELRNASDLAVYYYGDSDAGAAWYPAENVVGRLATQNLEVSEDGAYLGAWVNHGGIVRLGLRPAENAAPAGVVPSSTGTILCLGLTAAILLGAGRRRRTA